MALLRRAQADGRRTRCAVCSTGDVRARAGEYVKSACLPAGLWSAHECAPYPMGKLSISYTNHCEIMYPKMFRNFVIEYYLHLSHNVVNILISGFFLISIIFMAFSGFLT